jgi:hypothetical protein
MTMKTPGDPVEEYECRRARGGSLPSVHPVGSRPRVGECDGKNVTGSSPCVSGYRLTPGFAYWPKLQRRDR